MNTEFKPQILLAEDEPNIAFSLQFILEKGGFEVAHTVDGAQVLQMINAIRPELIILDIMLPNKSGFEILEEIRTSTRFRNIPVLILSARGQSSDFEKAAKLGADDYITKPYSNNDVVEKARELIAQKRG